LTAGTEKSILNFFQRWQVHILALQLKLTAQKAYNYARENGHSFFATYLHRSMVAVNAVDELKLRILEGQVVLYDTIHAGTTIGRADGTFGFAFIPFSRDFEVFQCGYAGGN
jgi:chloramphenicol O-acetyltransferase type A